jgi:dipeptidyl aminopeptidase/acylaminoacyl peptidase
VRDSRAITTEPPPPPAGARIAYGGEPLQFGDLRLPDGPGPHPLVVAIHGGFWRATYGLTTTAHVCHALAARGVATWNLEYRRLGDPGGGWPGTLEDVALGVRHVRRLAHEHPVDVDDIVLFGHSAGGQLALWAARELPLRAVVSLAGVVDLEQASRRRLGDGVTDQLLGGTPEEVPERYERASPVALLPLGVRQVLVHGTEDDIVPFDLSEGYAARARAAGDDAVLVTLDGVGHFEPIDPQSRVFERMLEILTG